MSLLGVLLNGIVAGLVHYMEVGFASRRALRRSDDACRVQAMTVFDVRFGITPNRVCRVVACVWFFQCIVDVLVR